MSSIHIGSPSEYVKITFPASYLIEGWSQADVEISVNGFNGKIQPWVEATDLEEFTRQLRKLYDSLQGKAVFRPREEQFTLALTGKTGGHIEVAGTAWSKATYENKLEFILEIDQTFLSEPLRELESLAAITQRGSA